MKVVWSIILGLAMLAGQLAAAAPDASGVSAPACVGCSCAELDCCPTSGASTPLSVPTSTANDFRVQAPALFVVALLATSPQTLCPSTLFSSERSLSSRAAIPVYDRVCSYLI
jgi:hypothetical protein